MGTRSLTFVYDDYNDTAFINMYRQFDGYPEGHGAELAEFLNSFDDIVNGIPVGDKRKLANGMGCLAAQMIAHFKTEVGNFYLYPVTVKDCGQDYEYHVHKNRVVVKDGDLTIFNDSWKNFEVWCKTPVFNME
jgi:hypothetical protein